ncbi:replication initiation protein (plasmid) [Acinetobacter defluvii]|uniref:Replication initiation protein n=1 Tax=Acinetobacter defluvii TaxID=1871111 RepID=A0A2S2FA34_9GAMM|nr:replication initiation protein RepM [Acinetobacter defluvii]AWL27182.1 replication initiation protein [Acinetobacter defluvii]
MNELIVKDNALINASYNLETIEQRLVLLAIIKARKLEKSINSETVLRIHATDYMEHFKVSKNSAYEALKNASNSIFSRQFSYIEIDTETGNKKKSKSRWVQKVSYIDDSAIVEMIFTNDVIPLVTQLEESFTSYQMKQVSQLTGKYAIRIYELIIQWRKINKTPMFELNEFRRKLGLGENDYPRIDTFKTKVIESSLKQINKSTDIVVDYDQHKEGRSIIGFSFRFRLKDEAQKPIKDMALSEKQIPLFANKLAHDAIFSGKYAVAGETYEDFEKRLLVLLGNAVNVENWKEDLYRVGYDKK